MRAIILAAGRGSRLPNYLSRNPKCFIKLRKDVNGCQLF